MYSIFKVLHFFIEFILVLFYFGKMSFDNLALKNQICFALYNATNSIIRYYNPLLSKHGITYTQFLVMIIVLKKNSLRICDIAEQLNLPASTITPVVKKLEKLKLLKKSRNLFDERNVDVIITKQGVNVCGDLSKIQNKVFCKADLSSIEFSTLKKTLEKLINNLEL